MWREENNINVPGLTFIEKIISMMTLKLVHNENAGTLLIVLHPLRFNGGKKHFFCPTVEEDGRHESICLRRDQYFLLIVTIEIQVGFHRHTVDNDHYPRCATIRGDRTHRRRPFRAPIDGHACTCATLPDERADD
jgi:hypothetical protein